MRLGIYAFFNETGELEACDRIYLEAVAAELDELVIVVNGAASEETRRFFAQHADDVFYRENVGLDAGAFREALLERLPQERWRTADELVLFNNTMIGPFRPLGSIFQHFTAAPVDFWGMTLNHSTRLQDHIQSYFLVFKQRVLSSAAFLEFWQDLRMDFTDWAYLVVEYEVAMAQYLAQAGFSYDVVSVVDEDGIYSRPMACLEAGVPVLKKKTFRSHVYGVTPAEYRVVLQRAETASPSLRKAICAYMAHGGFDSEAEPSPEPPGVLWTNEEILSALRPYRQAYFYGLTIRSFYVATLCREKQCIFVESDACYHGPHQGEWPVRKLSELPTSAPDDAIMVVFLRKKHADALRVPLEERFHHVIYLCEPPTGQA